VRIGIDVRVADPTGPGQQRYLWRLGAWLAGRGDDVHYLTVKPQAVDVGLKGGTQLHRLDRSSRAELRAHVAALGLDVLLLNPERSRRYRGLGANVLRSAYGTEHYVQKLRSFRNPAELALRRGLRTMPWVVAERRWERAFYESTRPGPEIVAQSDYMRRQILGSYAVAPEHVHVIHNAVDLTEFTPAARLARREAQRARWGIAPDALCLLFLGHNFRLKGLWQLVAALGRLDLDVPAHLLVVGRGTGSRQRRKAEALVRRHGLQDRVTLAGTVATSLEALAAADLLLHLSWHDSFGFVTLEAMACGVPVVTTRYTGAAELVTDGESGLLLEPDDDAQILQALRSLASSERRREVGDAAALRAAGHDEPSNFAAVRDVMERARARAPGPVGSY